jgi:serine/threonine-protein kinase
MFTATRTSYASAVGTGARELFGYRIIDTIGEGAGSLVYAVKDERGRKFALKHVTCETDRDGRFVEQLKREHEVSQAVTDPAFRKSVALQVRRNLLGRVREAALVLELIDGHPVRAPMSNVADAARLIHKVAHALAALHGRGYVHCDLKPQNVMVQPDGVVRLIDFGQACAAGTVKPRIQGTPDFIAPEQVRCEPVSFKTDIFGLGAVAYHLLTAQKLTTLYTLKKGENSFLLDSAVQSPRDLRPEVPVPLSDLVMECTRTSPQKRPELALVIHRLEVIRFRMKRGVYARACA